LSATKFIFGGVVLLALAGGVFGYTRYSHRTASTAAANTPAEVASSAPTSPSEVAAQPETPAPAVTSKDAPVKDTSKVKLVEDSQPKNDSAQAKDQHKTEAKEPEPMFIRTANGSVKKPSHNVDVQAPTLMAGLAESKMPQMNATIIPPKPDFPIASVTAPKLINGPRPVFPSAANTLHLTSDTVVLNAKVMTNGKIGEVTVLRGHPVFVEAVKEAIRRWQYTPATLDHRPTEATVEIVFKFGQAH
jgi:TonB family protein